MNVKRAGVVAQRVLRQLRRDRRTMAMLIVQPFLMMGIFGYAFGGDVIGAHVAVANLDRGSLARAVIEHVDASMVDLRYFETELQVEQAVRDGSARLGVVFPANFSRNLRDAASGDPDATAYLVLYVDNTNPQVTGELTAEFAEAMQEALEAEFDREGTLKLAERPVFGGPEGRTIEFFTPGVAAYLIFIMGSMLTVVTIVKERTMGTLPRLLASPVHRIEVVLGFTASFGLFALLQAVIVLGVAAFFFDVPIQGSVTLALAVTTLIGVVALGIGILVSGVAKNEFQAVQSVMLVAFPSLFLAGIFAPYETMPWFIRPLSRLVPLTYGVDALRNVINHAATLADVGVEVLALLAFAAAFLGLSAVTFGRRPR